MVYIICKFIFIYAIIGTFSSYTFAPWTTKPQPPAQGTIHSCFEWLLHDGFKGEYDENLHWARSRATIYDQDVSYFAAAFAYLITNAHEIMNIKKYERLEFCDTHTTGFINYPYITLKDAEFTCEGWIHLYLCNRPYSHNRVWIIQRDTSMDNQISMWAALYFQRITYEQHSNEVTTPREFCISMSKPVLNMAYPKRCPFMTLFESKMSSIDWNEVKNIPILEENLMAAEALKAMTMIPFITLDTKLTCYAWIKLWRFSDDISINYQLVLSNSVDVYSVNVFAENYIMYIRERHNESQQPYQYQIQNQILQQLENLVIHDDSTMALQRP